MRPGVTEVSHQFFQRPLVPVANPDNAATITAALTSYLDADTEAVVAVHVIEKAGGALDKASVEQRELAAAEIFETVADGLDDVDVSLETEIHYGTDVPETIVAAAHDADASAIVFSPREGSRWQQLLSGDVTHNLLEDSDIPVVVLTEEMCDA